MQFVDARTKEWIEKTLANLPRRPLATESLREADEKKMEAFWQEVLDQHCGNGGSVL